MARPLVCARPGCGQPTAAWLTYDYAAQCVWLDDSPGPTGDQWGLCADHAGRLRAPRGWTQVDRRVSRPRRYGYEPPTSLVS